MSHSSRLAQLGSIISAKTSELEAWYRSSNTPFPSLDALSAETASPRDKSELLEAVDELRALTVGPEALLWSNEIYLQLGMRHALYHLDLPKHFPADSPPLSFGELAKRTGIREQSIKRIFRSAVCNFLFVEVEDGVIAHNAPSRAWVSQPVTDALLGGGLEDLGPATLKLGHTLHYSAEDAESPSKTGFSLANNTDKTLFDYILTQPKRLERFGLALGAYAATTHNPDIRFLLDTYPWAELPQGATVVDIGGSTGDVTLLLAKQHSNLNLVIQDLPPVAETGKTKVLPTLDAPLQSRISFEAHDFFTPQPEVGAAVYFARWIMHDWSDTYCIKILRAIVPGMTKGAKLIINERIMPGYNEFAKRDEVDIRFWDMAMWSYFNAKERDLNDWKALVKGADERLEISRVWRNDGSHLSLLEVVFN